MSELRRRLSSSTRRVLSFQNMQPSLLPYQRPIYVRDTESTPFTPGVEIDEEGVLLIIQPFWLALDSAGTCGSRSVRCKARLPLIPRRLLESRCNGIVAKPLYRRVQFMRSRNATRPVRASHERYSVALSPFNPRRITLSDCAAVAIVLRNDLSSTQWRCN